MKKFLALLLTLVMALSLAACGGSDEESTDSPAEDPAANEESSGSAADVKIGLICVHDINSGYDAAHIEGLTAACEELGIEANSQVIFRYNIAEDENCYDAAVDLAEEGCNIIFSDSYGHQSYMLDAADRRVVREVQVAYLDFRGRRHGRHLRSGQLQEPVPLYI